MFEPGKLADLIAKPATDQSPMGKIIAWLETQPKSKTYQYNNCKGGCLFGQYQEFVSGIPAAERETDVFTYFQDSFTSEMIWAIAGDHPHTFGAALDRARAHASPSLVLGVR